MAAVPITVSLPTATFDTSVPIATEIIQPVNTTLINAATTSGANYVGFQGDFTFDSAVVTFSAPFVQAAGLTATNWNVSANILNTGPGTTQSSAHIGLLARLHAAERVWGAVQPEDAQGEQQPG